ncbi:hypothetical protein SH2C18_14880 [Clostridium sediminicola]|uniref:hypothetical protein n=1 Tax=Clostridium sediminicola TaxID=3114879 RepID=UPI0031F21698
MIFIHKYKKIGTKRDKAKRKNWISLLVILIFIGFILIFKAGFRISPLAASRVSGFIQKEFELLDEIDLDWAYIHFYYDEDNDMYYTTISEKKFFMYVSHLYVRLYGNKNDPIKTIGSMFYSNGKGKTVNLFMVKSDDENIDSIIIRQESKIIERKIQVDNPEIIVIDNSINWDLVDVVAVDKFGKEKYYYGVPKGTGFLNGKDIKWHKVKVLSNDQ